MIALNTPITPTSVQTAPPKLSKGDKSRLETALAELAQLDRKLAEIESLRDAIAEASRAFARGEITLAQAAGLASIPGERIAESRGALRSGCKAIQRELVQSLADIVTKHREQIAADLLGRCSQMEKGERQNAAQVGVHDDDFRASGLLERLREQHRRASRQVSSPITRSDLHRLATAAGLVVATDEEADPLADIYAEEVGTGERE